LQQYRREADIRPDDEVRKVPTFGLTHRSKAYRYSITSSARASMVENGEADWRFGIDIDHQLEFGRTPH
jgi:hypothetical protein